MLACCRIQAAPCMLALVKLTCRLLGNLRYFRWSLFKMKVISPNLKPCHFIAKYGFLNLFYFYGSHAPSGTLLNFYLTLIGNFAQIGFKCLYWGLLNGFRSWHGAGSDSVPVTEDGHSVPTRLTYLVKDGRSGNLPLYFNLPLRRHSHQPHVSWGCEKEASLYELFH